MHLNAQQQLFRDEVRKLHRAADRRHERAAEEVRTADSRGIWDEVLDAHQRKMRAAAQRDLFESADQLVGAGLPVQAIVVRLEDFVPQSRGNVVQTTRTANARIFTGRLDHDRQPPQLDQAWSDMHFAIGQCFMLEHLVSLARFAAQQTIPRVDDPKRGSKTTESSERALEQITAEAASLSDTESFIAEQESDWRRKRADALRNHDSSRLDQSTDSLSNLAGRRSMLREVRTILERARLDSTSHRRDVAEDLQELWAFAQAQQTAWQREFSDAIAHRDVDRGESANEHLNRANGAFSEALQAAHLARLLRDSLD